MTKGGKAKRPGFKVDELFFGKPAGSGNSGRKAKRIQGSRNHHDSIKGNRGNGGGKRR